MKFSANQITPKSKVMYTLQRPQMPLLTIKLWVIHNSMYPLDICNLLTKMSCNVENFHIQVVTGGI